MTAVLHALTLLTALAMLYRLAVAYRHRGYACPACGTRRADRHAADCPWRRGV